MSIDEQKFGELIGTVGALVTAVADMKGAIIPALKDARMETQKYREEMMARIEKHEAIDHVIHANVVDLVEWVKGDGTQENLGARKIINGLMMERVKVKAYAAGIAAITSLIIGVAGYAAEVLRK